MASYQCLIVSYHTSVQNPGPQGTLAKSESRESGMAVHLVARRGLRQEDHWVFEVSLALSETLYQNKHLNNKQGQQHGSLRGGRSD